MYSSREQLPQHHPILTSDTSCKFRGSPRPPSGLVICGKDSENSLEARVLTVLVYYSKEIQGEIRQGQGGVGQGPDADTGYLTFFPGSGDNSFPEMMCDNTHRALPPGMLQDLWCPKSLLGLCHALPRWQCFSFQLLLEVWANPSGLQFLLEAQADMA